MQIAGASLFGILLSKYDPVTCMKLAARLMIWTLPVVVIAIMLNEKHLHCCSVIVILVTYSIVSACSYVVNQQAFSWGA